MKFAKIILSPGSFGCYLMGVDPDADAGLLRWMLNTLFYLTTVPLIVASVMQYTM